jgi:DNA invertase Pin-like site-specific DNA recombinase
MKQAIIYTRISTNTEQQNIKQQRDYCKKYAENEGYDVLHLFGDKMSGKTSERSGYQRMLKFLSENTNVHLIVQDLDRLTRNYYDGVDLEIFILKNNITIKSISESVDLNTPSGKFMFRMKIALNALYVENLLQKIRVGVERAKKEGKYKGRKKGTKNKK